MGRPTLCTPEVIATFEKAILDGCTLYDAADLAGVSHGAADDWMARGKPGDEPPYSEFFGAVTRARAAVKQASIKAVRAAALVSGAPDWRGPAWLLERQHPGEYGPQQVVAVKVEQQLEKALDRLDAIKDKIGADTYNLVCAALLGERAAEEADGAGGGSESR